MKLDDSIASRNLQKELSEELATLQEELAEDIHDREIDLREDNLSDLKDTNTDIINSQKDTETKRLEEIENRIDREIQAEEDKLDRLINNEEYYAAYQRGPHERIQRRLGMDAGLKYFLLVRGNAYHPIPGFKIGDGGDAGFAFGVVLAFIGVAIETNFAVS